MASGSSYGFIVGPSPNQQYSVTVNVTYQLGGSGTATLTFTSEAPTGSLAVAQRGTQTWSTTENPGDITVLPDPEIEL